MTIKPKKPVRQVGADRDDFEVDVTVVRIYRTRKERLVETAITVTTTVIAVTVSQAYIIPMLVP